MTIYAPKESHPAVKYDASHVRAHSVLYTIHMGIFIFYINTWAGQVSRYSD